MSGDGWKLIAEAMRRRQEEEAWKVRQNMKDDLAHQERTNSCIPPIEVPSPPRRKRTRNGN